MHENFFLCNTYNNNHNNTKRNKNERGRNWITFLLQSLVSKGVSFFNFSKAILFIKWNFYLVIKQKKSFWIWFFHFLFIHILILFGILIILTIFVMLKIINYSSCISFQKENDAWKWFYTIIKQIPCQLQTNL